jgi:YVTN family beta-propeller protein
MNIVNSLTLLVLFVMLSISTFIPSLEKALAQSVVATVDVGDIPFDLEYNPSNEDVYVANKISHTVSSIDSITNEVTATVNVGNNEPRALEYNPSNEDIYVAGGDVYVIDSITNKVTATLDVGIGADNLEYNPSNGNVYVSSGDVYVIDSTTNEVTATVDLEGSAIDIEYNPSNENIYAADASSRNVYVIDSTTNEVTATVDMDAVRCINPFDLEYNPSNENIYVTCWASNTVSVIDSNTNLVTATNIRVGNEPRALEYNPSNEDIYVANHGSHTVSVIDSNTNLVTATVDVGSGILELEYNPSSENIYVANGGLDTVSVIDSTTNEVTATLDVGDIPNALEYNPSNEDIYVANQGSGTVSVISDLSQPIPPTADAGADQAVDSGDIVQLDGSGSTNPSGDALTYQWTQIQGPDVTLSDSTAEKPTFTAPLLGDPQNLVFELVVANEQGVKSEPDRVTITVNLITPPTATTITSATDGNGNTVEDKGSTVSTSITFQVTATKGTNDIAGFECSLDNSAFSSCATSNPATINYDNLASDKKHTFQVRAVDTEGNTDPNPAVFEWTVLTPKQAINKLKDTIVEMDLSKSTTTSLQAPLNSALKQIDRNNEKGACGPLGAFLDQVNEKRSSGQLTSTQADDLRQQATAIQKQIGCTTTGASAASTSNTNSESNSPLENMIDSAFSNLGPMQSEQTDNARDKIHEGLDMYSDFFDTR